MNKNLMVKMTMTIGMGALLVGCGPKAETAELESASVVSESKGKNTDSTSEATKEVKTKGEEFTATLGMTNWQGTVVQDKDGNDLTAENTGFIGLAKYDGETGRYEFFDKATGETRGDEGIFFVTNDGTKRILISQSNNYQAVVGITELTKDKFTYKRMGKDKAGNEVEVFVEHVPYSEKELAFTNAAPVLDTTTGPIETAIEGSVILGKTLWNGTKVIDEAGNDVTEFNKGFISLAKFNKDDNRYEFFDLTTGQTRGDFGYFDVINNNKIRTHVSIGANKYGAALELTELNKDKFTYKRMGKDKDGKEITIFVEHEPYKGEFKPEFTF
ncbi:DUF4822 domain-containing protein [Carnobacterium gallinarum]|uniref:DUF4822 domain-containing protein n=1 Tax=Carnobacterium gallinarum TaxID=2749 RepID=UPI000558C141|nr:DUF4822 domain-containing protein [Carnobacterium gallinarum]